MTPEPIVSESSPIIKTPSTKQQSWGTLVSIVIIVLMIIIGAFYAWGARINAQRVLLQSEATSTTY